MAEWLNRLGLVRPVSVHHKKDPKRNDSVIMFQKLTLIIVFLSGVCLAYFFSNVSLLNVGTRSIWGRLSWITSSESESVGKVQPSYGTVYTTSGPINTGIVRRKSDKTKFVAEDVKQEALAAVNLAKEMEAQGKHDKALKLLQHALNLDPTHSDILNQYGEFLELHEQDIVQAEHMYSKALVNSPLHSKALANRKRTLPLVEEIDQNKFNRIDLKREQLIKIPENHPGLRRAKRESYFHHIYHTVAIEGNTMTLSQTRSVVETKMAIAGKSVMEHNEVLGLEAALNYINSTLMNRLGRITLQDILEIHKRVMGFNDPIEAGKLRNTQVFVGQYVPPSASEVGMLMDEFVQWLNCEESLSLHPIEFAALAHYKLVFIHPFYDGNGRTSRLLMNLILMQAGFPPIIIRKEEKHKYYQHLETANDGDVRPFIRFISECLERTLDEYLLATIDNPNVSIHGITDYRKTTENQRMIYVDP